MLRSAELIAYPMLCVVPCVPCLCGAPQVLALEMLILLLENPSDDSVEMAVDFCKEVRGHERGWGGAWG